MVERDPSSELKDENARLIALLEANGIQWRVLREPVPPASAPEPSRLSTDEKVALFRRLFRGRYGIPSQGMTLPSITLFESDELKLNTTELEIAPFHKM